MMLALYIMGPVVVIFGTVLYLVLHAQKEEAAEH